MNLIKFRIQHYKSIKDSGWCWLASDLTILAGKNESGKSAILEALRDFYYEKKEIPEEARPLSGNGKTIIEMCFKIEEKFFNEVAQKTGITMPKVIKDYITKNGLTILYKYNGDYDLESTVKEKLVSENNSLEGKSLSKEICDIIPTPKCIFFGEDSDILPFEIPIEKAKNHEMVKDFATVAKIDLDAVFKEKDTLRRKNLVSDHSAVLRGDFGDYWNQDKIELVADTNGDNLIIGFKEEGKPILFKAKHRSKGLQWFLSFYMRLSARGIDTNIFLIDEPGLYLHAKAKSDVLKFLEKVSEKSQIIFSTHSPYLIDAQRLDRVRLILKDNQTGTKIENKIQKGADVETRTPIITAIGHDISHEFSIAGKKNVLLEGISDYYYLQSLKVILPEGLDANLIPCTGATKVPQIASLLIGWDLDFVAVLDNDGEGKRIAKELREKLQVCEDKIIHVSDHDGYSIEDLFTHDDFNNYVLNGVKNNDHNVLNSKFLKDENIDKVLLSKKLLELVEKDKSKVNLSQQTIDAFKIIYKKIAQCFNTSN